MAILDGEVNDDSGSIDLPLILNPDDRPRQMVSHAYGKPALTKYEVVKRHDGRTWVKFHPITGRTHQLRVHAAHCDGLNAPILGDTLYGTADKRLYLHACSITFRHPHLKRQITIDCPAPF
jgi:tRNA pseudouridine32 synthase/23S rRNA pseudouridine746 synthase